MCDRHTSDKVAHYSIYRPRKDERLSWPASLHSHCGYSKIVLRIEDSNVANIVAKRAKLPSAESDSEVRYRVQC